MKVNLEPLNQHYRLYYTLSNTMATSRGYTIKNAPVELLSHAYDIAKRAESLALDKWFNNRHEV